MNRKTVKELAKEFIEKKQPLDWFEVLYAGVDFDNLKEIPWADFEPNPSLIPVIKEKDKTEITGKTALVIGCGLGDDAEFLQNAGYNVSAFDISVTAVKYCKKRFPNSAVNYFHADLIELTTNTKYDFIFEAYTLQVLPKEQRDKCYGKLPNLLAKNGQLLIVARGRNEDEPISNMPFPLTKNELKVLEKDLKCLNFEDYLDSEEKPVRRFRVQYTTG